MKNLNAPHISDTERQVILAVFDQLLTLLTPKFFQLSAEERQRYGSVNEQNKLFINKVFEFKNAAWRQDMFFCCDALSSGSPLKSSSSELSLSSSSSPS